MADRADGGTSASTTVDARSRSYRDEAIVLRTWKLGEADRIIVLYTVDNGKVRAIAKGVRRTRSSFGSRLEPGRHVVVQLYRGRGELDTVTQAAAGTDLAAIRDDLERFTTASAMLEAVDLLSPDREADGDVFRMLKGALGVVARDHPPLALAGFLWKLLAHEGYHPMVNACVACGSTDDLVAFDFDDGGVRCAGCRRGRPVGADALDMIRLMLGGHLNVALQLPSSPAATEATALAVQAVEYRSERELRSVKVLGIGT